MSRPARAPLTWHHGDDGALVLDGALDERAELASLPARAKAGVLVLDCGGITFVNSVGVREWIRMQQTAMATNLRVELRRVAVPIVHQLNIVPATRGNAIVRSFYAPYACERCESDEHCLIDVEVHRVALANAQVPTAVCSHCGREMLLADPPEIYFSFVTRR